MEKEVTGLYLSGHPMDQYRAEARRAGAVSIGAVKADFSREEGPVRFRDGQQLTLAGVISAAKTKTTKNNSLMAYITLEDDTGSMELLAFSRVLTESGPYIRADMPVIVKGRISVRDEKDPQLMCDSVQPMGETDVLREAPTNEGKKLWVRLEKSEQFDWLRKLFAMFPGDDESVVYFQDTGKRLRAACVQHPALLKELREKLGTDSVVLK